MSGEKYSAFEAPTILPPPRLSGISGMALCCQAYILSAPRWHTVASKLMERSARRKTSAHRSPNGWSRPVKHRTRSAYIVSYRVSVQIQTPQTRRYKAEQSSCPDRADRAPERRTGELVPERSWAIFDGRNRSARSFVCPSDRSGPSILPASLRFIRIREEVAGPLPLPDKPSVVVLPFDNAGADTECPTHDA